MRRFLPVLIIGVLGTAYLWQKQNESPSVKPAVADRPAAIVVQTTPIPQREVSEHNWMKRSLDRARNVTREVQEQRKSDDLR